MANEMNKYPNLDYNPVDKLGASPAFSNLADVMMMCLSSMISSHKILRHLPTTNQILKQAAT